MDFIIYYLMNSYFGDNYQLILMDTPHLQAVGLTAQIMFKIIRLLQDNNLRGDLSTFNYRWSGYFTPSRLAHGTLELLVMIVH